MVSLQQQQRQVSNLLFYAKSTMRVYQDENKEKEKKKGPKKKKKAVCM